MQLLSTLVLSLLSGIETLAFILGGGIIPLFYPYLVELKPSL